MRTTLPCGLLLALLTLAPLASAQTAAALDPKTQAQYENLLNHKFSRDLSEVFTALERASKIEASTAADTRFLHSFRLGDWTQIRAELSQLPPDLSRRIFDKILADLTERQKSGMKLDDILALVDALPGELNDAELRKVGELLSNSVPPTESFWLAERLRRGTAKLGGKDPARRLAAGRVLLAGGFKELALAYLPERERLDDIKDEALRQEVAAFLSAEQASEFAQREQIQKVWDENVAILNRDKVNDWDKTKAAGNLARVMTQVQPANLDSFFRDLIRTKPDVAVRLIAGLQRKMQTDARSEPAIRVENLRAQSVLATLVANHADATASPWNPLLVAMADEWMNEVEATFAQRAALANRRTRGGNNGSTAIEAEELLGLAPMGKWLAVLGADTRDRLDASLSRAVIASANFEAAADRITELAKRHPSAGVALAEDFLSAWSQAHNPLVPEELRRKYGLPEDARIPVTPVMMERNIDSLAKMMALFRAAKVTPRDQGKIVAAFDQAYSNAEAYRESHIEKVFGPAAQMDEQVFFLLTARMHTNLSERWRRPDLQRSMLTRRTDQQTYEMVQGTYASLVTMVDAWTKNHPTSSRALIFGGQVLNDWSDFEYLQELAPVEPAKRVANMKERSLQALEYFQKGADAYGREIIRNGGTSQSIEPYLVWFNALVGIGHNNTVNLAKTVNRAGLQKIRTSIQGLPGKAAQTHMNLLAKTLNARLTDERDPLHEDVKYRYLAAALVVTKDDPFTMALQKRATYLDELLSEVRVQTRLDGPNTVGANQEFGIFVSVIHTEAMGRVAKLGQYLTNDAASIAAKNKRRGPATKKGRDTQGPRDEFEMDLMDALSPFFVVRSITFATPDVKPRATARPGWEETVMAYVLVRAKDASVDKVPPVKLDLKFIDLSGPVTVPAVSAETLLKVSPTSVGPRPAGRVEVTQTLDTRQFGINGQLNLDILATGTGLVPDLDDLVDLDIVKRVAAVRQVGANEGLQIKELNTWGEQVTARSERHWIISLDGDAIRAADKATEVPFAPLKNTANGAIWRTYEDMDLKVLPKASVRLDRQRTLPGSGIIPPAPTSPWFWPTLGSLVALLGLGLFFGLRGGPKGPVGPLAREVFQMPAEVDGFAAAAFLRRYSASPLIPLNASQKGELAQDLAHIQQGCFNGASTLGEPELRAILQKWLKQLR